jgi:ribonuclease P protein component
VSARDAWGVVFGHPNGLPYPRLGLSVSKRLGGAVVRNRWKRLLREAFRQVRPQLPVGVDLIVIPRVSAPPALNVLRESLSRLAERVAQKTGHCEKKQ